MMQVRTVPRVWSLPCAALANLLAGSSLVRNLPYYLLAYALLACALLACALLACALLACALLVCDPLPVEVPWSGLMAQPPPTAA